MTTASLDAAENHSGWVNHWENALEGKAGAGTNGWQCPNTPRSNGLCTRGPPSPGKAGVTRCSSGSQPHLGAPPQLQPFSKLQFGLCPRHTANDFALSFAGFLFGALTGKSSPQDVLTSSWGADAGWSLPLTPFGETAIKEWTILC